jgi:hypothetical protein
MTEQEEAWKLLVKICRGASSMKELLADLRSGPADSRGWPFFQGAVRFATSLDFADLGDERGPIDNAIDRLAQAGDERAIKLRAQLSS